MADWVVIVDTLKDFDNAGTPHKVITANDYLARANLFQGARPKVINLSRSFAYQSRGYYCSLLAEARGHRVIPSVETMIDLGARQLYAPAIPELEDALGKALAGTDAAVPARLLVYFGTEAILGTPRLAAAASVGAVVATVALGRLARRNGIAG